MQDQRIEAIMKELRQKFDNQSTSIDPKLKNAQTTISPCRYGPWRISLFEKAGPHAVTDTKFSPERIALTCKEEKTEMVSEGLLRP